MRITDIAAEFEKRVSDDNYGSEASHVRLAAALESGDDPHLCLQQLMLEARSRVHMDLSASVSGVVRRRVELPKTEPERPPAHFPTGEEDDEERLPF